MKLLIDRILSDEKIKFNDAIKMLRKEMGHYSEEKRNEIKEDLNHAFNFDSWDFK